MRKNGLLFLRFPNLCNKAIAMALTVQTAIPELWHRRMAHMGHRSIKQLGQVAEGVKVKGKRPQTVCEPYEYGKGTKKISRKWPERATSKLELIHSDVGGPIEPTSLLGHRYCVAFTDDFTQVKWIRFMKQESEVLQKFKEFKSHAETQSSCKLNRLWSDNGGEYRSAAAQDFYKKHGIQWEPSAPYSLSKTELASD